MGEVKEKKDKNKFVIVLLLTIIIILLFRSCSPKAQLVGGISKGTIDIEGMNTIEIQNALNNQADKAKFKVFLNSNIILESPDSMANLLIQNNESNRLSCTVQLYEINTDKFIYTSETIPAGYKLENSKLDVKLPKGKHECLAIFSLFDVSGIVHSTVKLNVTITVLGG